MELFVELLKITLPAIIVAVVSYLIIRTMLNKQLVLQQQRMQQERQDTVMPLRMQAYERLSILVERLAVPGLVLRSQNDEMQATTFKIALFMAVQQEFEHNISQQIYVSDNLWKILEATRDDLLQFIDLVSEKVPGNAPARELADKLLAYHAQRDSDPVSTAQMAIRREAGSLF